MDPRCNTTSFSAAIPSTGTSAFSIFSFDKIGECIKNTPIESIAFLVASAVVRIFSHPLAVPLLGVGISMLATTLVLKALSGYDQSMKVYITKKVCIFNKKHPRLHLMTTIFAFAISFISKKLGFLTGVLIGSFGTIILDVEKYKLMQKASRKT
ncbi:MAG: hypothetical protein WCF65_06345 [Parachlamydiaceae bacterium]